jgi:hypothetical protein
VIIAAQQESSHAQAVLFRIRKDALVLDIFLAVGFSQVRQGNLTVCGSPERKRLPNHLEAPQAALRQGIIQSAHGGEEEAGGSQGQEEGRQRAFEVGHIVQDMIHQNELKAGVQVWRQHRPGAHGMGCARLEPVNGLVPVGGIGFHEGEPQPLLWEAGAEQKLGGKPTVTTPKVQHPDGRVSHRQMVQVRHVSA